MLNFLTVTQKICQYVEYFVAQIIYTGFQVERNEQHQFLVLVFSILIFLFLLYFAGKTIAKFLKRLLNSGFI